MTGRTKDGFAVSDHVRRMPGDSFAQKALQGIGERLRPLFSAITVVALFTHKRRHIHFGQDIRPLSPMHVPVIAGALDGWTRHGNLYDVQIVNVKTLQVGQ